MHSVCHCALYLGLWLKYLWSHFSRPVWMNEWMNEWINEWMMFLLTCDKKLTKSQLSPTHASTKRKITDELKHNKHLAFYDVDKSLEAMHTSRKSQLALTCLHEIVTNCTTLFNSVRILAPRRDSFTEFTEAINIWWHCDGVSKISTGLRLYSLTLQYSNVQVSGSSCFKI